MGRFQGNFRHPLKIIGTRKSYETIEWFKNWPRWFDDGINRLQLYGLGIVGVMVVRNPFDMIATRSSRYYVLQFRHIRTGQMTWINRQNCSNVKPKIEGSCYDFIRISMANGTMNIAHSRDVDKAIREIASHAKLSDLLMRTYPNFKYIQVQLEDLIANPRKHVTNFCTVLDLDCNEDYIQGVLEGVLDSPNPSRNGVKWTPGQIKAVNNLVDNFPRIFSMPEYSRSSKTLNNLV
ncbi:uncharacterized protein LOC134840584 [Symsagittifera roscoffensis]|uniref:uncharacterized protein LOC134840584 n=1 Tax=Symsagittifera roscoffensis TaxID=84072 RepID=UPI00307BCA39